MLDDDGRVEELAREAWILREQGSGTRLTFDQAMRHRPTTLNVRLELEHTEAIKRAVESGLGIGCISRAWICSPHSLQTMRGSLISPQFLWRNTIGAPDSNPACLLPHCIIATITG